jgi:hypothetical protein
LELESILKPTNPDDVLKDFSRQILQSRALFIEYRNVQVESRSYQETQDFLTDIQKLSLIISKVDPPSMHILRCKETVYQSDLERFVLIYELPSVPHESQTWTLAQAIADKSTAKPALDVRVRFAVEIATAVMFTHAAGLVHKSICPENILSWVVTLRNESKP